MGKENSHYSDKLAHYLRGQTAKDLNKIQKLEGHFIPKGMIDFTQRRNMRRISKSGR